MDESNESESLSIERTEIAGGITDEPIISRTVRQVDLPSKHRKTVYGPFFCKCGNRISKENIARCCHCKALLCENCRILYLKRVHCLECLKEEHGISLEKPDYKMLLCISNGIVSPKQIFRITGIKADDVKEKIDAFMDSYLTRKPTRLIERIFPKLKLTDLGRDALGVFDAIYGEDADSMSMKQKLLEVKQEKAKRRYSLRAKGDTTCSNRES